MARKAQGRKKGSGTLYKRGNIWFAKWEYGGEVSKDGDKTKDIKPTRRSKSTGTSDKREALKILDELTAPLMLGDKQKTLNVYINDLKDVEAKLEAVEDDKPALSILMTWDAYLASTKRPDSGADTLRMYESQFSRLAEWLKTNRPAVRELRQVDQETAQAFSRYLAAELSANSFNKYMTLFRRVWKVLYQNARLTCNPWDKDEIRPKREDGHSRRELTIEELAAVCSSVSGEMRLLFAIGIYTGLRLGDAVRLSWGEVDLVRGVLSIVPRKTARDAKGKRVLIPIHKALLGIMLEAAPAARTGKVLPDLSSQYETSTADLSKKIQAVFTACGIETVSYAAEGERGRVEVGFHSLRHTFVSLSANAGTPLAVVQAIVGHSNPAMTRHYYHESETALTCAVDALPDVMGGIVPEVAQDSTDAKLDAFAALVDGMTKDELKRAKAYIKTKKDKNT